MFAQSTGTVNLLAALAIAVSMAYAFGTIFSVKQKKNKLALMYFIGSIVMIIAAAYILPEVTPPATTSYYVLGTVLFALTIACSMYSSHQALRTATPDPFKLEALIDWTAHMSLAGAAGLIALTIGLRIHSDFLGLINIISVIMAIGMLVTAALNTIAVTIKYVRLFRSNRSMTDSTA